MKIVDFDYKLPESLIGQEAIEPRDSCRLIVVNRAKKTLSHRIFSELPEILDTNTILVLNDTKVFPARLFGTKDTGGKMEVLLLKQISTDSFEAIVRGKTNLKQQVSFDKKIEAQILSKDDEGMVTLKFSKSGLDLIEILDKIGNTPLPPYIHSKSSEKVLREKYQTVYAREKGSAAAPTAGLHFTPELLSRLGANGIQIEKITLHVGLGTFKPVTDEQVVSKTLHAEKFFISEDTASRLNAAKKENKRIVAVGTTTCRALESMTDEDGKLNFGEGETRIFIQPGYRFKFVNSLITNFHLPQTSLLMLVSSLVSFPNSPTQFENFQSSLIGKAYAEAIEKEYKFFSFGDAMLIL